MKKLCITLTFFSTLCAYSMQYIYKSITDDGFTLVMSKKRRYKLKKEIMNSKDLYIRRKKTKNFAINPNKKRRFVKLNITEL